MFVAVKQLLVGVGTFSAIQLFVEMQKFLCPNLFPFSLVHGDSVGGGVTHICSTIHRGAGRAEGGDGVRKKGGGGVRKAICIMCETLLWLVCISSCKKFRG